MDRTGMAMGNLRPVIYFEAPNGYVVLPPIEEGKGEALARKIFSERYHGWEWREAGTWSDVTKLQKRLQDQAWAEANQQRQVSLDAYDAVKRETASNLRQRMASSDCTPFERGFIESWLRLSDEKRKVYEQRFLERNFYLWSCEQDSSRKVEELMPTQPGEFLRT